MFVNCAQLKAVCVHCAVSDGSVRTVLTADDLVIPSDDPLRLPQPYKGLNSNNVFALNGRRDIAGFNRGVTSPPNVLYNGDGEPGSFTSVPGSAFKFVSAQVTSYEASDVATFMFTDTDGTVRSPNVTITTDSPTLVTAELLGIDSNAQFGEWSFYGVVQSPGGWVILDDIILDVFPPEL